MINPIVYGMSGQPIMIGGQPVHRDMRGQLIAIGNQPVHGDMSGRPIAIGSQPVHYDRNSRTSEAVGGLPVLHDMTGRPSAVLCPPLGPTPPPPRTAAPPSVVRTASVIAPAPTSSVDAATAATFRELMADPLAAIRKNPGAAVRAAETYAKLAQAQGPDSGRPGALTSEEVRKAKARAVCVGVLAGVERAKQPGAPSNVREVAQRFITAGLVDDFVAEIRR